MIKQWLYGIGCAWEALKDFDDLRLNSLHKAMVGCENDRAGSPTLYRFENRYRNMFFDVIQTKFNAERLVHRNFLPDFQTI